MPRPLPRVAMPAAFRDVLAPAITIPVRPATPRLPPDTNVPRLGRQPHRDPPGGRQAC